MLEMGLFLFSQARQKKQRSFLQHWPSNPHFNYFWTNRDVEVFLQTGNLRPQKQNKKKNTAQLDQKDRFFILLFFGMVVTQTHGCQSVCSSVFSRGLTVTQFMSCCPCPCPCRVNAVYLTLKLRIWRSHLNLHVKGKELGSDRNDLVRREGTK